MDADNGDNSSSNGQSAMQGDNTQGDQQRKSDDK